MHQTVSHRPVQGNSPGTREDAVCALINYLKTDPTSSGDSNFLVMGDLNAYGADGRAADAVAGGQLVQLRDPATTYSYLFNGALACKQSMGPVHERALCWRC